MADNMLTYYLGLAFRPGNAVPEMASEVDRAKAILRGLNQGAILLNPRMDLGRLRQDLHEANGLIRENQLRASQSFAQLGRIDPKGAAGLRDNFLGIDVGKTTRYTSELNAYIAALSRLEEARKRVSIPYGASKELPIQDPRTGLFTGGTYTLQGFRGPDDARAGVHQALKAVEDAARKHEAAEQQEVKEALQAVEIQRRINSSLAESARAAAFVKPYPNAREDSPVGRAQIDVNTATRDHATAEAKLADVIEKEARGEILRTGERAAAESAVDKALTRRGKVIDHLASLEARHAGTDETTLARQRTAGLKAATELGRQINEVLAQQLAAEKRVTNAAEAQAALKKAGITGSAANVGTPVGAATAQRDDARLVRQEAERRLADVQNRARLGELEASVAVRQGTAAQRALTQARMAELGAEEHLTAALRDRAHQESTGRFTALREQFATGFAGRTGRPYAEQIGQAFKFSVFYGTAYKLLFALTQTFQQTLTEGIAFQNAITELKIASGRTKEELDGLTESLSAQAVRAGFAPSQGLLVGARSLGLFGVTTAQGGTAAEQDRVATISARVVSQLATGSKRTPVELQTDIAAITQAFGQGAEGQFRVADLDAFMSRFFGVGPGETIQSVSEAGTVARAAGFSQEETAAIAAQLMSRTGQTAPAVAGFMAQIFSRGGEGTLAQVSQRYGIDPTQKLADQIEQLANIYKTASSSQKTEIAAAFGRGKVQNAAIALLQDYGAVQQAASQAKTDAGGAADAAFAERMKNVGGQLQLLAGVMREFASLLGESGLLHVLGLGIVAFRELLESVNGFLRVWNGIPGVVRTAIAAIALLGVTSRTAAGRQALGVVGNAISYGAAGQVVRGGQLVATPSGLAPLASRAGVSAAASTASSALISGAASLINPITVAIGGLVAVGQLKGSADRMREAQEIATETLRAYTLTPGVSTGDDYRVAAATEGAIGRQLKDSASGFWARTASFFDITGPGESRQETLADAEMRFRREKYLTAASQDVDRAAALATPTSTFLTDFSEQGLATAMEQISKSGGTAAEQLAALRDVLYKTAGAADRARASFDPGVFAAEQAGSLVDTLGKALGDEFSKTETRDTWLGEASKFIPVLGGYTGRFNALDKKLGGSNFSKDISTSGQDQLLDALNPDTVEQILREDLERLGVKSLKGLGPNKIRTIARDIVGTEELAGFSQEARDVLEDAIISSLTASAKSVKKILAGKRQLTPQEALQLSQLDFAKSDEFINNLPETALARRRRAAEKAVATQQGYIDKLRAPSWKPPTIKSAEGILEAGVQIGPQDAEPTKQQQEILDKARRRLALAQFNEFEALRRVAQQNAKGKAAIAAAGQSFLRKEIAAAVAGGDADLLARIIAQAGKGSILLARQTIRQALQIAKAAAAVQAAMKAAAGAMSAQMGILGAALGTGVDPSKAGQVGELQGLLDSLSTAVHNVGTGNVYATGSDVPGLPKDAAAAKDVETAAERAAARRAAYAIRSESPIQQAQAEIQSARVAMSQAKKGTVEYWNALGQFFAARNALTDAILEYRHNLGLLRIDATNPLQVANLAVRDALRKLRSDRGKGADVRAQDRVDLQAAQAEAEATRFSQRLQNVQTAEQLGRISHQAYIRYLENESARLNRIKNRTYQQQQQLNEIDMLLKEVADSAQGQFNFGDINLPKPYQVRRYIEESLSMKELGGGGFQADGPRREIASVVTINIDGADTGKVIEIIDNYVGSSARRTTTAARRR